MLCFALLCFALLNRPKLLTIPSLLYPSDTTPRISERRLHALAHLRHATEPEAAHGIGRGHGSVARLAPAAHAAPAARPRARHRPRPHWHRHRVVLACAATRRGGLRASE